MKPVLRAAFLSLTQFGILFLGHAQEKPSSPRTVSLNWEAPSTKSSAPVRYNVYRSDNGGRTYSRVASALNQTGYLDSAVVSGKTYDYVVASIDQKGNEGLRSLKVEVVVP